MAEIVNLRTVRKRRERVRKERLADENRALHGQAANEKAGRKAEADRQLRLIEGHRRDSEKQEP